MSLRVIKYEMFYVLKKILFIIYIMIFDNFILFHVQKYLIIDSKKDDYLFFNI